MEVQHSVVSPKLRDRLQGSLYSECCSSSRWPVDVSQSEFGRFRVTTATMRSAAGVLDAAISVRSRRSGQEKHNCTKLLRRASWLGSSKQAAAQHWGQLKAATLQHQTVWSVYKHLLVQRAFHNAKLRGYIRMTEGFQRHLQLSGLATGGSLQSTTGDRVVQSSLVDRVMDNNADGVAHRAPRSHRSASGSGGQPDEIFNHVAQSLAMLAATVERQKLYSDAQMQQSSVRVSQVQQDVDLSWTGARLLYSWRLSLTTRYRYSQHIRCSHPIACLVTAFDFQLHSRASQMQVNTSAWRMREWLPRIGTALWSPSSASGKLGVASMCSAVASTCQFLAGTFHRHRRSLPCSAPTTPYASWGSTTHCRQITLTRVGVEQPCFFRPHKRDVCVGGGDEEVLLQLDVLAGQRNCCGWTLIGGAASATLHLILSAAWKCGKCWCVDAISTCPCSAGL